MSMEIGKFRPVQVKTCSQQLETWKELMFQCESKDRKEMIVLSRQESGVFPFTCRRGSFSVLCRASTDLIRPTHPHERGQSALSSLWIQIFITFSQPFPE